MMTKIQKINLYIAGFILSAIVIFLLLLYYWINPYEYFFNTNSVRTIFITFFSGGMAISSIINIINTLYQKKKLLQDIEKLEKLKQELEHLEK